MNSMAGYHSYQSKLVGSVAEIARIESAECFPLLDCSVCHEFPTEHFLKLADESTTINHSIGSKTSNSLSNLTFSVVGHLYVM